MSDAAPRNGLPSSRTASFPSHPAPPVSDQGTKHPLFGALEFTCPKTIQVLLEAGCSLDFACPQPLLINQWGEPLEAVREYEMWFDEGITFSQFWEEFKNGAENYYEWKADDERREDPGESRAANRLANFQLCADLLDATNPGQCLASLSLSLSGRHSDILS